MKLYQSLDVKDVEFKDLGAEKIPCKIIRACMSERDGKAFLTLMLQDTVEGYTAVYSLCNGMIKDFMKEMKVRKCDDLVGKKLKMVTNYPSILGVCL